ncbi:sugar ABC transporter ATP-binding protein, partial [Mesorhizobium sp. M2C.T.Ca.TU.009.01.2.1]
MQEVLRLQNLQKSFGSVRALKNASLTLKEGEVVALLGDNGAGKSTLIKAISGVFPIDRGDIYVRGEKVSIRSTREAMDLGIETIHQDTSLAPDLSIARNLFLGREPVNLKWLGVFAPLDLAKLRDAASALLKRVGISKKLDADALVSTLSGG